MHRCAALLLAVAALGAGGVRAEEPPATSFVGDTRIVLPVPAGFVEPSIVAPGFRTLGEQMTARSNRLLALFVAEEDLRATAERRPPAMLRYFMVQTLRAAEAERVGAADFALAKTLLREQYQQMLSRLQPDIQGQLDRASQRVGEQAGLDKFALKLGELRALEVFDEQPQSISLLALSLLSVSAGEQTRQVPIAMGTTTLVVKDKLVYFFAYARYESDADLEWLRQVTRDWLPKVVQLN
jgi:hypothetical protein